MVSIAPAIPKPIQPAVPASLPAWEIEREARLHDLCIGIAQAKEKGTPIDQSCRRIAQKWDGKPFKADSSRSLKLSMRGMRRLYFEWRRGGEHPSAFRLQYKSVRTVTRALAFSYVKAALLSKTNEEAMRLLALRRKRRGTRKPLPDRSTFLRLLPPGYFARLRAARASVVQAEQELARLHLLLEAHVITQVTPRPPRTRLRCTPNFSI